MRSIGHSLGSCCVFLGLLLLVLFSSAAQAETLEEMERICQKAKSLEAFLNDPILVNEYYEAASKYFGGTTEFPRTRFDGILDSLRLFNKTLPEFKERAWETTNLGPSFVIASETTNFGRTMNHDKWDQYLSNLKSFVAAKAEPVAALTPADLVAKTAELSKRFDADIVELDAKHIADNLTRRSREIARNAHFELSRRDPELQLLAHALVQRFLERPELNDYLGSENPDLILTYLRNLKNKPSLVLEALGLPAVTPALLSEIKSLLPETKALLSEDAQMFPAKMVATKRGGLTQAEGGNNEDFHFKAVPRRFHAIFKGIACVKECVGGSPNFEVGNISPERWAAALLEGTHLQFVERGGQYLGFTAAMPLMRSSDGSVAASLEFGSRSFNQGVVRTKPDGTRSWMPLSMAWFHEANKRKPSSWRGYLISESGAIDNAGAKSIVRTSPEYLLADEKANKSEFTHVDPLGQVIPTKFTRTGNATTYGGKMITDGTIHDAGVLRLLKPVNESLYQFVNDAFTRGDTAAINEVMARMHVSTYNPLTQTYDNSTFATMLKESGLLGLLARKNFRYHPPKGNAMNTMVPQLRALGFSGREMFWLKEVTSAGNVSTDYTFIAADIDNVHSLKEFLRYLMPSEKPSADELKLKAALLGARLGHLLSLHPAAEHLIALTKGLGAYSQATVHTTLLPPAIAQVKTPADYLRLTDFTGMGIANSTNQTALTQMMTISIDSFLRMKPAPTFSELATLHERIIEWYGPFPQNHAPLRLIREKIAPRLVKAWVTELRSKRSAAEFLEQAKPAFAAKAGDHRSILIKGIADASAHFFEMGPTADEKKALRDSVTALSKDTDLTIWRAGLELGLRASTTPEEYLAVIDPTHMTVPKGGEEAMTEVLTRTAENFRKLTPTSGTVQAYVGRLAKFPMPAAELQTTLVQGLSQTTSALAYLALATAPPGLEKNAIYIAAREGAIKMTLDHFVVALEGAPENQRKLLDSVQEEAAKLLIEKLSARVTDPARYLELGELVLGTTNPHIVKMRGEWLERTLKTHFFDRGPSLEQLLTLDKLATKVMGANYVPMADAKQAYLDTRLRQTTSPGAFVAETTHVVEFEKGAIAATVSRQVVPSLEHFLQMSPSITDKETLRQNLVPVLAGGNLPDYQKALEISLGLATSADSFVKTVLALTPSKEAARLEATREILEVSRSHFEALLPTNAELKDLVSDSRGLISDATKTKIYESCLQRAHSPAEYLTLLSLWENPTAEQKKIQEEAVKATLTHYLSRHPSLSENLSALATVTSPESVGALLRDIDSRSLATTAEGHLALLDRLLKIPEHESIKAEVTSMITRHLHSGALDKKPSWEELNQLAKILSTPPAANISAGGKQRMQELTRQRLQRSPTIEAFVAEVEAALKPQNAALAATFLPALEAAQGKFLSLKPEPVHYYQVREALAPFAVVGVSPAWESALHVRLLLSRNPEEYLALLERDWSKTDPKVKAAVTALVDKTYAHFRSRKPSPAEGLSLARHSASGILSQATTLHILEDALAGSRRAEDYVDWVVQSDLKPASEEYVRARREAMEKTKAHFFSLTPHFEDYKKVVAHTTDLPLMIEVQKNALDRGQVTRAGDYLELMAPLRAASNNLLSEETKTFLRSTEEAHFFGRSPSNADLWKLRDIYEQPSDTHRLMERGLKGVQDASAFVEYVVSFRRVSSQSSENVALLGAFLEIHREQFEKMSPTVHDYIKLLPHMNWVASTTMRPYVEAALGHARTAQDFLAIASPAGHSVQAAAMLKELLYKYLPDFWAAESSRAENKMIRGRVGSIPYYTKCALSAARLAPRQLPARDIASGKK